MGKQGKTIDMSRTVWGNVRVIERYGSDRKGAATWRCECLLNNCGKKFVTTGQQLRSGKTRSCGCLVAIKIRASRVTHGMAGSPEQSAYYHAKTRCTSPKCAKWKDYGGRGIEFRFASFEQFLAHVGRRPSELYTLERINVNGHYEIGNVKWATYSAQALNKRQREGRFTGVVSRPPFGACFQASISHEKKLRYLGSFPTARKAARAYNVAALRLRGPSAKLNVID